MYDKTPRYNLGVVIRETGTKPDTLRAWERRYGVPQPQRTSGGHRLYSQFDIETIKWLQARQKEGMRISNAVRLWKKILNDGKDPWQLYPAAYHAPREATHEHLTGVMLSDLRERWVANCLEFDEASAEYTLAQSFALYPPETVCLEILQGGLSRIGDLWYQDIATVQQEHFASSLALRRVDALLIATPPPELPESILIACAPGEDHSFMGVLLTYLMRKRGYNVIHLGQNVPESRLLHTIQQVNADLTVLIALQLETAANLLRTVQNLNNDGVPVAYGGFIFTELPELRKYVPAHFLGEELEDAPYQIENLLKTQPETPSPESIDEALILARSQFDEKEVSINAQVMHHTRQNAPLYQYINVANFFLAKKTSAALAFGSFSALDWELDRTYELITNRQLPVVLLKQYLEIYLQALQDHLDQSGQPIIDWFSSYIDRKFTE
jgi:DNA-binding transcriptional MerR regulator